MGIQEITEIPRIPERPPESHKGNYGKVLILAGSRGMSGAALLCGEAALRSGSGLVFLGVPESLNGIYAVGIPCALTLPLQETSEGTLSFKAAETILSFSKDCDAVALGPGISRHPETEELVRKIVPLIRNPLILDADGINALEKRGATLRKRRGPTVLTPHPKEMSRITEIPLNKILQDRKEQAVRWAREFNAVVVLKGHKTVVSNGAYFYINLTGNAGMATGGSGDVLTGIIVSLLGQGFPPLNAAITGTFIHGLAGDMEKWEKGEISLIASDLISSLPRAFMRLQQSSPGSRELR